LLASDLSLPVYLLLTLRGQALKVGYARFFLCLFTGKTDLC
jgi:hypothetical protein